MTRCISLTLTLLTSCSLATSPDLVNKEGIEYQSWTEARRELDALGYRTRGPEMTNFTMKDDTFDCDGAEAYGCYDPKTLTIEWAKPFPNVLPHECCHAILHQSGYPAEVYESHEVCK